MDLHDYDDVAENYDLYLNEMYKEHDAHEGFQEFYLDFAREYGSGGVIDIACGTGAVLLYLAERVSVPAQTSQMLWPHSLLCFELPD